MLLVTFCCVANGWLFPDKHTFEPSTGTKTKLLLARAGNHSQTQRRHFLIGAQKHCQFMTETLIAVTIIGEGTVKLLQGREHHTRT